MKSKIPVFVVVLYTLLSVVSATVYLAPDASTTWSGGSCDCGSEVSPCAVSSSAVTATDATCSIFVYGGNYGGLTLQLTASSSALTIQAQTTSVVSLNLNLVASTIQLDATTSRLAWTGSFTLSSSSTTSTVTFSRLALTESTFSITSRAGVTLKDCSVTYTGSASNVFVGTTYRWSKFEVIDSSITAAGKYVFWNTVSGTSDAIVTNSVITTCTTFFQGWRFNYINITSSSTYTTGHGVGVSSGYGPAYVNVYNSAISSSFSSNRLFAGAIISRFNLYHSTVSKLNLIGSSDTAGIIDWYNNTITDTIVDGSAPRYRFQNITLIRSGDTSTTYGFRSADHIDVDFTARSTGYESVPILIVDNSTFSANSNITASSVYFFKSNTIAGRWTHTGTMLNVLYDPTTVHSCNSMPTSIWTMGTTSMIPVFNMTRGGLLIFRSDGNSGGYIYATNGFYLPPTVQVLWTPKSAPVIGTEYRFIYNVIGDLPAQIPALGDYQFDIYFKLESNNVTKSIFFRYTASPVTPPVVVIPPTTPPVAPIAPPVAPIAPPVTPPIAPVAPPMEPIVPPTAPVSPPLAPVEPPMEPIVPPTTPVFPEEPISPPVAPVSPPTTPVSPPEEPISSPIVPPVAPVIPPVMAPVIPPTVEPIEPPTVEPSSPSSPPIQPIEPPTAPVDAPVIEPISPPEVNVTGSTPVLGQTSPTPCPLPSPGDGFNCVNGVWIYNKSISQPDLSIPGGGTVHIIGNLTVESEVTFHGTDSEVIVDGCVTIGGVVITLTKEDMEKLSEAGSSSQRVISSTNGNNCPGSSDLSAVAVTTNTPSGCKRVKTSTSGDRSSLTVLFAIDRSRCNIAIIVPAVVGGVLVLVAIIIIIVLAVKKPWVKEKYSTRASSSANKRASLLKDD